MVNHNHHPLPGFSKVVISKGFKFLRMNTCRSVDCKRVIGDLSIYKSNCLRTGGSEGVGAGEGVRMVGGVEFTRKCNAI